jgi:ATP-dependent Clp protease adaptor protein ClpS
MLLDEEPVITEEELSDVSIEDLLGSSLVVHNDDVNTFEWVIECLCSYLKHSREQAEQCAWLIHTKGKCKVKSGTKEELEHYKDALLDSGLSATIE